MYPEKTALYLKEMYPDLTEGTDWSFADGMLTWNSQVAEPTWAVINGHEGYVHSSVKVEIASIEETITKRRLREATLGIDNGWLEQTNAQIAALRERLR